MYAPLSFALHYYLLRLGMFSSYAIMTHAIKTPLGQIFFQESIQSQVLFLPYFPAFSARCFTKRLKIHKTGSKGQPIFRRLNLNFSHISLKYLPPSVEGAKIGAKTAIFLPCFCSILPKSHYILWFEPLFFLKTTILHHYHRLDHCFIFKGNSFTSVPFTGTGKLKMIF